MVDQSDSSVKGCLTPGQHVSEESEYVRLVVTSDERQSASDRSYSRPGISSRYYSWWLKVFLLCVLAVIVLLIFGKWGVPFAFEKVFLKSYFSLSMTLMSSYVHTFISMIFLLKLKTNFHSSDSFKLVPNSIL